MRLSALTLAMYTQAGLAARFIRYSYRPWRVLDAGLYLPGADRAAVFKAYDKLGGLDRLGTVAGGMLVDLVKLDADADGCERAQIALRLRYNAHIECAEADCEPLRRVLIRSDETGRFVCQ